MKNGSAVALVVALAGVGALVGLGAAVVWHLAVPTALDPVRGLDNSPWFPTTLYLVGAGVVLALILSSFLVDGGLRVFVDRHRPRTSLFVLLVLFGIGLGVGAAACWSVWPPDPSIAPGTTALIDPTLKDSATATRTAPLRLEIVSPGEISGEAYESSVPDLTAVSYADEPATPPSRPTVAHPWLVFPAGGAAIAGALAVSLSMHDVRVVRRT